MTISSQADLAGMHAVGRLVADALSYLVAEARPGISTGQLDDLGARFLRQRGARSAPQLAYGFPGCTCISVDDEIVHGVPGPRRLRSGNLVKIDVTAELGGFVADAARTVALPPVPSVARRLIRCARRAFRAAMAAARPERPVRVIGRAIEREVRRGGFAVLRELTGHGLGREIHESPTVANFEDPSEQSLLHDGLVAAVEPLIAERAAQVIEDPDGWTLRTHNGALAAHYENTIVIRRGEPLVLTATWP
jgi:methionyl aminopeptidase